MSLPSNTLDGLFWADAPLTCKSFAGFNVVVETPRHGMRQGPGWMSSPPADYGYIVGTTGADGDELDVYLGLNPESDIVYVVDQNRMNECIFDEHKCMLGYSSIKEAKEDYLNGHTHGTLIFRNITALSVSEFRKWIKTGDMTKPIARQ
jgi:Inorganic Pyrophosphatase